MRVRGGQCDQVLQRHANTSLLNSFISSKSANKVRFNYVRLNGACSSKATKKKEKIKSRSKTSGAGEGEVEVSREHIKRPKGCADTHALSWL